MTKLYNHTKHSTTKEKPIDILEGRKQSQQEYNSVPQNVFSIGDKVQHLKKVKTFTKKSFKNPYSLKVYQVQNIVNNRYELNNGKFYDFFELIHATEISNNNNNFGKQIRQIENTNKEIRTNQNDFKMPIEQIESQKLEGKRQRKQTNYFIHS